MGVEYDLYYSPLFVQQVRTLPGQVRQRARVAVQSLTSAPRPPGSRVLDASDLSPSRQLRPGTELRRLRIDRWRLVYAVHDDEQWVMILAVHKRPPYQYENLSDLVSMIE